MSSTGKKIAKYRKPKAKLIITKNGEYEERKETINKPFLALIPVETSG